MDEIGQEQATAVQSLLDAAAGKSITEEEKRSATELLRAITLLFTAGLRFPHRLEGFSISTNHRRPGPVMTLKLHFGVIDQRHPVSKDLTTGDIAKILEAKYHPFGKFYEAHGQEIADELASGMKAVLDDVLSGGIPPPSIFADAENNIRAMFTKFIDSKEMDSLGIPGVPTKASLEGISHRKKQKRRPGRPSFVDTGTTYDGAAVWVEADDS